MRRRALMRGPIVYRCGMRSIRLCLVLTLAGCSISLPSRYEGAAPPPPVMTAATEGASEAAPSAAAPPVEQAASAGTEPAHEKRSSAAARTATAPATATAAAPAQKAPAKPAAASAKPAPVPGKTAAASAKPAPEKAAVTPAKSAVAPAPERSAAPPLDLKSLEERLKDTSAIGLLTKLSLKNQVDDLVARFKAYHAGDRPPTLAQLRPAFDLLLMKVLSLLQDKDPGLANDVHTSRDAIWGVLVDPVKFSRYS